MHREWAWFASGAGLVSLIPAALITHAFYAHVWHYRDFMAMAAMVPVYASLLAGPVFMLLGWLLHLKLGHRTPAIGRSLAVVGAGLMTLWCLFALWNRPPDLQVRVAASVLAILSLATGVWTVALQRRSNARS